MMYFMDLIYKSDPSFYEKKFEIKMYFRERK